MARRGHRDARYLRVGVAFPPVPGLLETFPRTAYLVPTPALARASVPFPLQARGFVSVGRTLAIFPPHPLAGHVVSQWHKAIKREPRCGFPVLKGQTLHWTWVGQVGRSNLPVSERSRQRLHDTLDLESSPDTIVY